MADLIAQGGGSADRWRRRLPVGEVIVLGRAAGVWSVPWDLHISRHHAQLFWDGRRLEVRKLPEARNPIFFRGRRVEKCTLLPEQHFVIGQTSFLLIEQNWDWAREGRKPRYRHQYSYPDLAHLPFQNPDHRIEVLTRLPEVLSGAGSEEEMCVRLISMLLAGLPRAEAVAIAILAQPSPPSDLSRDKGNSKHQSRPPPQASESSWSPEPIRAFYWDERWARSSPFRPSRRLILESLLQRRTVLHVWAPEDAETDALYTHTGEYDWAFCTPIFVEGLSPWGIYLTGRMEMEDVADPASPPSSLQEEIKFTELVASIVGALRRMRRLERQQAVLSQFLSPLVLRSLSWEDPARFLSPQETEVVVLFCDLRGFSRHSEQESDLRALLDRVSQALSVMSRHILEHGGVVGDYQGDAALGFWGWPVAWPDMIQRSCQAALAIREEFLRASEAPHSPLAGFRVGIGMAAGRAVAGKIGPPEQAKLTVFGPVVNLAARLESMTKFFHTPILLDPTMAEAVRQKLPSTIARLRRVAVVRPYGMDKPVEITELLPPAHQDSLLSDQQIRLYEAGLDAFLAGRWQEAYQFLHQLPPEDRVADFLIGFIAQHHRTPPHQWEGVIPLDIK